MCDIWINVLLQTSALVGPLHIVNWNSRWNSEIGEWVCCSVHVITAFIIIIIIIIIIITTIITIIHAGLHVVERTAWLLPSTCDARPSAVFSSAQSHVTTHRASKRMPTHSSPGVLLPLSPAAIISRILGTINQNSRLWLCFGAPAYAGISVTDGD
jgi:disulfide bond formation protein DsbB